MIITSIKFGIRNILALLLLWQLPVYSEDCKKGFRQIIYTETVLDQAGNIFFEEYTSCENINECAEQTSLCQIYGLECVDLEGSYLCICENPQEEYLTIEKGFVKCKNREEAFLCSEEFIGGDVVYFDPICEFEPNCNLFLNEGGAPIGDVLECVCAEGFFLSDNGSCFNINECKNGNSNNNNNVVSIDLGDDPDVCPDVNAVCSDTYGGYQCKCKKGFVPLVEDGDGDEDDSDGVVSDALDVLCVDIDECLNDTLNLCGNSSKCNNVEGSFFCDCGLGYIWDEGDESKCIDDNECLNENKNECNMDTQVCVNIVLPDPYFDSTGGSYIEYTSIRDIGYFCQCRPGWCWYEEITEWLRTQQQQFSMPIELKNNGIMFIGISLGLLGVYCGVVLYYWFEVKKVYSHLT